VDRILVGDQAARLQVVERAQQGGPVGHATAFVELATVAGDDTVLELGEANGVGELAEAAGAAHDVEQGFERGLGEVGGYLVEQPVGGSGGGPGGHERGIDGRGRAG